MMTFIQAESLKSQFHKGQAPGNFVFIDVREPLEYAHEHIAHSVNIPLKKLSQTDWSPYKGKTAVFHCASGNRTKINQPIIERTPFEEKYCLEGGLKAWKIAGLPTEVSVAAPIDVMRQVQLVVSVMILSGLVVGYLVSPYFFVLPVIAGIGLMVAGLTGFCGMAIVLSYAPWNRAPKIIHEVNGNACCRHHA